jgi:hypothetical protein
MDSPEVRATRLLDLIDSHLATGKYEWARPTLEGIAATVTDTGVVTIRQQEAVEHIILGRIKHGHWGG